MGTRIGRLPLVRTVKHVPAVEHAWDMGYRSRLVRERVRFVLREVSGRRATRRYHLAGSGLPVHLRHQTSDLDILEEVFGLSLYAMPDEVRAAVGHAPRVLDLGGHIGLFGAWALGELPGAAITAVEADPANAAMQQRTLTGHPWRLLEAVASTAPGQVAFRTGAFAESGLAEAGEIGAVTLPAVDALALMAEADLVKIDIEGGEWPILADTRLADVPARALTLEYHPRGCPAADPRAEAHRLLAAAGFTTREIEPAPIGAGMLWGWRT